VCVSIGQVSRGPWTRVVHAQHHSLRDFRLPPRCEISLLGCCYQSTLHNIPEERNAPLIPNFGTRLWQSATFTRWPLYRRHPLTRSLDDLQKRISYSCLDSNPESSSLQPVTTLSCLGSHLCVKWRSWLRYCGTSQKVAGSIPDKVIGLFH